MCRILFSILLCFFLFVNFSYSQKSNDFCYGKALMPDVIEKVSESYPIYLGKDFKAPFLKWQEITVTPEKLYWEERVNPNCLSDDPKDCMMVCSASTPAVVKNYQIVTDLDATKEFEWINFEFEKMIKKGTQEYVTVVCENKIDEIFVEQLSNQLKLKGYYDGPVYNIFSQHLKNSLIKYQKEHGFPEGALDLVTLASLGFGYSAN